LANAGETSCRGKRFSIRLDRDLPKPALVDTVLHEWAHCLAWYSREADPHGRDWSVAYGRVYREWERMLDGVSQ